MWGVDGGVGTVQVTKPAHRGSWLRLRRAPKPSFYPEETLRNIFPKDDTYLAISERLQTADRLPLADEVATKASRGSFFSGVGGNGRDRAVSVPKIILRPHFKKENLRLFWGAGG